jgi:hypothetical protein
MNYSEMLVDRPWIPYLRTFFRDSLVLEYPQNVVFVAQLLHERLSETRSIYEEYPRAEQFDLTELNGIEWEKEPIVFDSDFRMIKAPEPVRKLENLYRRLKYADAKAFVFGVSPANYLFNLKLSTIALLTFLSFIFSFWFNTYFRKNYFPNVSNI